MKGLEKLTCVRLAEVITQKNVVTAEVITDALYSQDKYGEPFVQTLINGGHITEWDLAKIVAENFQLPFLMASNYQIGDDAKKRLPQELLFQHLFVPLDVFDEIICIAMPILTPFDVMAKIQREHDCELFPYVGLVSENKKVLGDLYPDFKPWFEAESKRREKMATMRANAQDKREGGNWMSIFDAGEQAIQKTLGSPGTPSKGKK